MSGTDPRPSPDRPAVHDMRVVTRSARGGLLQIGQVAERTHLSLRTIRSYEEKGLVGFAHTLAGRLDDGRWDLRDPR